MIGIILLAIIQGISEFLPISSSAHLILLRDVFHIGSEISADISLVFDLALHLGTVLAIIVFFHKDFIKLVKDGITKPKKEGKLLWYIALATIPAALAGLLFEDIVDSFFRKQYILIAVALILMGIIIYICDKKSKSIKKINDITLKDALLIGFSQTLALIPGFSRSGTTIACSRLLKIEREDSAKFSFFLSVPVVLGAITLKLIKKSTWIIIGSYLSYFSVGIIISFITGMICIGVLLKYLKKNDFKLFMYYRIIFAMLVIIKIILLK